MRISELFIMSLFVIPLIVLMISTDKITIQKDYYDELQVCNAEIDSFECPVVQCKDSPSTWFVWVAGLLFYGTGFYFFLRETGKKPKRKR